MKLKFVFVITVITALFPGCLTQEKAVNYLKDRKVLDDVCAENYPTPIKEIDSSGYKASIKTLDSLMAAYEDSSFTYTQEINELRSNIKELLELDTLPVECDTLCEAVYRYAAKKEKETNTLQKQVGALTVAIRNIKPIKEKVIDSAYTQILWDSINAVRGRNTILTLNLESARADISEFKSDKKKPLTVLAWFGLALASQWWFWVVIVGFIAYRFRGTIFKLIKSFIKI